MLEPEASGVRTTVIDYTLSRADVRQLSGRLETIWSTIEDCVFEGDGDAQFDTYRSMRAAVSLGADGESADWSGFHPITNLQARRGRSDWH